MIGCKFQVNKCYKFNYLLLTTKIKTKCKASDCVFLIWLLINCPIPFILRQKNNFYQWTQNCFLFTLNICKWGGNDVDSKTDAMSFHISFHFKCLLFYFQNNSAFLDISSGIYSAVRFSWFATQCTFKVDSKFYHMQPLKCARGL